MTLTGTTRRTDTYDETPSHAEDPPAYDYTASDGETDNTRRDKGYVPKHTFLLCSVTTMKLRIDSLKKQKSKISPQQLSTKVTENRLELLKTADLIDSVCLRFKKLYPQSKEMRSENLAYYNWLLLDLSRRIAIIRERFEKEYGRKAEVEYRRQFMDRVANENTGWSLWTSRSYGVIYEDGTYFDLFPVFVPSKRTQMLHLADVFGDEICAFTEFVDLKEIGEMSKKDYEEFFRDLTLVKYKLDKYIGLLKLVFANNPITPYEEMTPPMN